jgi:signal transduction histidine kinase
MAPFIAILGPRRSVGYHGANVEHSCLVLNGWDVTMQPKMSTAGADDDLVRIVEELKLELSEARRREAATAEVLKSINRSTFNLQDVLDSLIESVVQLTGAETGILTRQDGEVYRVAATYGAYPKFIEIAKQNPLPPGRQSATGRAVLERRVVHIHDVFDDPEYTWVGRQTAGVRTILAVPMLREDIVVGVIICARREVRAFTAKQIELVQTFADQAVIAIENTRMFEEVKARNRELSERTRELSEALEYQTATSGVLSAIGRSKFELQPVLDTLVASAARLCDAELVAIHVRHGDAFPGRARYGVPAEMVEALSRIGQVMGRGSLVGRTIAESRPVHIPDAPADPEYTNRDFTRITGARSMLGVPLLRDGRPVGLLSLYRTHVSPFTDRQIELMATFADQAVIAIENTRLFEEVQARTRELQESLKYQTATSDVLGVISRSPNQLQPVLDAIVETAFGLCPSDGATIMLREADRYRFVADAGYTRDEISRMQRASVPADRGSVVGRVALEGRTIHVQDVKSDPEYTFWTGAIRLDRRTVLGVPLVRDGSIAGVIILFRTRVEPYSRRQIELVETFADQAVIAMNNARLFDEIAQKGRELEIASQHKSQFVANMSHELRTPLAAVLGYAELLQEGIYDTLPEKSLPILTRIRSNGQHLLGLINTVLDISKIEAGQFKLNIGEYALGSVVETVMVATESLAATKKLAFKMDIAKELPYGLGDEQRLTQVLLNLVGNAIKFTDAGEVRIAAGAGNGHFTVSVSDTGPGIPPEECEHIFEKFRQVDSSNTRAKGGTGLGLAIAREIVEMHGGRIWVESRLGQGSTFRMELPVRAPTGAA